jgi:hypothetical protein
MCKNATEVTLVGTVNAPVCTDRVPRSGLLQIHLLLDRRSRSKIVPANGNRKFEMLSSLSFGIQLQPSGSITTHDSVRDDSQVTRYGTYLQDENVTSSAGAHKRRQAASACLQ